MINPAFKIIHFTLTDAPGSAKIIFSKGCNFHCNYCFNPAIAKNEPEDDDITEDEVIEEIHNIKKRGPHGIFTNVDWLIFSGGEPCLHYQSLERMLYEAKQVGLKTGIYTNGSDPTTLSMLLELLDFVSIDYKWPFDKYNEFNYSAESVSRSIFNCWYRYLDHEIQYFRVNTTLLRSVHTIDVLKSMKKDLEILFGGYRIPVIPRKDWTSENYNSWTLEPFYNNNGKIKTLGDVSSTESFTSYEIEKIAYSSLREDPNKVYEFFQRFKKIS